MDLELWKKIKVGGYFANALDILYNQWPSTALVVDVVNKADSSNNRSGIASSRNNIYVNCNGHSQK